MCGHSSLGHALPRLYRQNIVWKGRRQWGDQALTSYHCGLRLGFVMMPCPNTAPTYFLKRYDHLPSGRHLKHDVWIRVQPARRHRHYCLLAQDTLSAEPPHGGNLHATQSGPWCWADIQSRVPVVLSQRKNSFPSSFLCFFLPLFHSSLLPSKLFWISLSTLFLFLTIIVYL
jgi:hypothetical protein